MTDQAQDPDSSGQSGPDPKNPLDQLVELLLYAPVGLAYEYEDVLPKLIKRGKSQVQLAKVLSQMAAQQGQTKAKQAASEGTDGVEDALADVLGQAASVLARGITEFGQLVGLAPTDTKDSSSASAEDPVPKASASGEAAQRPDHEGAAEGAPSATTEVSRPKAPIAGYDTLKAREIVPMLANLTSNQRSRVRVYEEATRGRKTILGKLDKLDR